MASKEKNEKTRKFFEKYYSISFNDPEIEEIHLSLFFLARAIHRYNLIKKGLLPNEKK